MAFLKQVIGPDEKLIGIASVHWIYIVKGFLWFLAFVLIGQFIDNIMSNYAVSLLGGAALRLGHYAFWSLSATGVIVFLFYFLMWVATEIGLTTKRVIYKRGLFIVDVTEVDLEEIKAVDINNGIFGTIFNYGYLLFDARFIKNLRLPAVEEPYRFVKALNDRKSNLKSDTMNVVLESAPEAHDVNVKMKNNNRNNDNNASPLQDDKYKSVPDAFDVFKDDDLTAEQKTKVEFSPAPTQNEHETHIQSRNVENHAPEGQTRNSQKTKKQPIVSEQDLKTRKQRLQERFMRSFKRNAKARKPA